MEHEITKMQQDEGDVASYYWNPGNLIVCGMKITFETTQVGKTYVDDWMALEIKQGESVYVVEVEISK
jgi:hypothetical protein